MAYPLVLKDQWNTMLRHVLRGTVAGATGTAALNIVAYLDMTIRGRKSSEVPAKVAGALTQSMGIPLEAVAHSTGNTSDEQKAQAQHRLSGLGARRALRPDWALGRSMEWCAH